MAYVTALVSGPNNLIQNQVYAMPGMAKFIVCDDQLQSSGTVNGLFSDFDAAPTNSVIDGGIFIRCTTGATVCTLSNP